MYFSHGGFPISFFNMNNSICKNGFGETLQSKPPTLEYEEKLMKWSHF